MLLPYCDRSACPVTAAAYVGFHTLIQTFVDNQMTMSWRPSSIMVRAPDESLPCSKDCTPCINLKPRTLYSHHCSMIHLQGSRNTLTRHH